MSINKDRFRALPIKERAALINTYVSGGVMDLAEMKRHYNSFGPGGDINSADGENKTIPESEVVNTSNYRQQIEKYNQLRQAATEAFNNYDWSKLNTLRDEADSLGKELAKYTLNEYSKYTSSPLNYGNWAGTINAGETQDIRYLLKSNIREDGKEATEWLKSYVNSDGFQRIRKNQKNWWEARHPYQKYLYFLKDDKSKINYYVGNINDNIDKTHNFVLDGYPEQSFAHPQIGRTFTYKRTVGEDEEHPFYETQMHEIDHLVNIPAVHYDTINAEVLDQNTNTKKNHHDEYRDEKHSDNIGVKYLLFKEGIYDARSNKDVTPEQIQQLREKYPKLRFLQQLNNEEAAFQINNVAQNTTNKDVLNYVASENIAAYGGRILDGKTEESQTTTGETPQWLKTLGSTTYDILELLDPTGISSWITPQGDLQKAIRDYKEGRGGVGNIVLESVGALPLIGKVGKAIKLGKGVSKVEKLLTTANKAVKNAEKVDTFLELIPGIKKAASGTQAVTGTLLQAAADALNMSSDARKYTNVGTTILNNGNTIKDVVDVLDLDLNSNKDTVNNNVQQEPVIIKPHIDTTDVTSINTNPTKDIKEKSTISDNPEISYEDFNNYINTDIRKATWKKQGFEGWNEEDLKYLYDNIGKSGWGSKELLYAIDKETNFNPYIPSSITSAIGLAQLTKDQMKTLFGNKADEVYEEYKNKTRKIKNIIDDTILQYKWMRDRIKSEPENMGYGRLKVNLLAPNSSLDSKVPKYVYDGSLTKEQQSKIKIGKSTYRDLMNIYNEEFKNKFNN